MDHEVDLKGITLSTEISRPGQASWKFSSYEDYLNHLVRHGVVIDEPELLNRPDLVTAIQADWHQKGQNGCNFARLLSRDAPGHGWATVVVPGGTARWDPDVLYSLGEKVRDAVADPAYTALSVIFPEVREPQTLVSLVHRLAELPDWSMETDFIPASTFGDDQLVRVMLRVRLNWEEVISWVLGFGPFDFLPVTRRAPFTEIALAVKPKGAPARSPYLNADPGLAHLADLPLDVPAATFDKLLDSTASRKRILLGGVENPAAKARVTFAVPTELWPGRATGLWLE